MNVRSRLLSLLLLLVALATVCAAGAVSASAGNGPETRVRAIDHPAAHAVGQQSSETAVHVGCLRPVQPGFVSGSCVATEAGGVEAVTGEAAYGSTPAGRPFTRHYGVETGPERNIPGSVVDEAIDNYPGKVIESGKTVHYDPNNDITVVTGNGDSIVSVHKGPPRAGQR